MWWTSVNLMDTAEVNMALTKVTQGLFKDFVNKVLAVMQNHSNIFLATAKAATGTFVDFDIPAGVKRVTVMFDGVSTNGTSMVQVQFGTPSGFEISGYFSGGSSGSSTTGVVLGGLSASDARYGVLRVEKLAGETYIAVGQNSSTTSNTPTNSFGKKTLSGTLDRIRITTVNDTDTFDAGTINVSWEF